uniref:Uncharacterized protein n=1 Tax=Ursus maritimus TaxID=29073 RepID=A0A452UUW4_URSMA
MRKKGASALSKRELAQQAVPSSSSWSPGVVVAAAFIVLSQNKGKCHRVVPGDFSVPSFLLSLPALETEP